MPDASLIHGRAIPAPELPVGTVTVRVVREAIGNNVVGQEVRLTAGGATRTAQTDEEGRAEFADLPQGADVRAEATVDGEALVSDAFAVPASGGLRVILVAGIADAAARRDQEAAAAAAAPPVRGTVVFGPNSRVMMEFNDDRLQVFYVLDVLNNARTPVDIGGPLLIDLPSGAGGAGILQGSSPAATVSGDRVTVTGPFAPGVTPVQVAYTLMYTRPDVTVEQTWPAAVQQLTVAIQQVGGVSIASPQFSTVGEVNAESGTPFLLASGPALPAGATLTMELSNLPVHSRTPVHVALGLVLLIFGAGAWLSIRPRGASQGIREHLVARRDGLLAELAKLERARRNRERHGEERGGGASDADDARRQRILAELEQIYGELDAVSTGPQGGGKGVAA
jgi:hypothetical protein